MNVTLCCFARKLILRKKVTVQKWIKQKVYITAYNTDNLH